MATRVFHDNFEDGTTDKWSFPGTYDHAVVVASAHDSGSPHAGTKMLECNWNGTVAWNDPKSYTYVYLDTWDYTTEFLIRLWYRYDADVDHVLGAKLLRLGVGGSGGDAQMFYCSAQMESWPSAPMFLYFESVAGTPGPITYSAGDAGDGEWHKLEIYIKNSTGTDGVLKVWHDGSLRINSSGIKTINTGVPWENLTFVSNWSQNEKDATNHTYFDDIEIFSDSTNGDACTGSLSDASVAVSSGSLAGPANVRWRPA